VGKQVPLVMYKRGTRTEIGMVSVQPDGSGTFQVSKDHWPDVKDIIQPGYEFVMGPRIASSTN